MSWFFGCFVANSVGKIIEVNSKMTANDYIRILDSSLSQSISSLSMSEEYLFMQDNDPKHKADKTMKWLADKDIKLIE